MLAYCKGPQKGIQVDVWLYIYIYRFIVSRIAEQREQLEEMLARDRERYKQEDLQIKLKMQEQGIR